MSIYRITETSDLLGLIIWSDYNHTVIILFDYYKRYQHSTVYFVTILILSLKTLNFVCFL